jgi:uncharacterized protein (TIGR02147 family)
MIVNRWLLFADNQNRRWELDHDKNLGGPRPSQFMDYKDYLKALYLKEKEGRPSYSYVQFAQDIGLGASNVAWLIVNNQRRLTRNTTQKIIDALRLKGYERQYFQTMILYTHSKDSKTTDALLEKLVSLKGRCLDSVGDERILKFYSQWHHAIVFEMVGLKNFSSEPGWIRARLNFILTEKEIVESLHMLEELELIRYDENLSRHVKITNDFETKSAVPGLGVIQYHKTMIELGKSSIEMLDAQQRDIGAVTVAINSEGMERIKQEVQAFRRYLMFIASQYQDPSDIMQINIQAFSLTQAVKPSDGVKSDE